MAPLFHLPHVQGHGGSERNAVMAVAPVLVLGMAATGRPEVATTTPLDVLIVAPASAVAAALYYAAWRIMPTRQDGWVAAAVMMLGIECLTLFALEITDAREVAAGRFWMVIVSLACLAAVLACAVLARRRALPLDPCLAGCAAGAVLGLLRLLGATRLPEVTPTTGVGVGVGVACGALLAGAVVAILALAELSLSTRVRLAVATAALSLAPLGTYFGDTAGAGARVTVGLAVLGAAVLLGTGVNTLRLAISQDQAETDELSHRLHEVEADIRDRRARMHEINSTIAGISSATQVMRDRGRLTARRTRMLEDMVETELARLGRLLAEPAADEAAPAETAPTAHPALQVLDDTDDQSAAADLDTIIEPLVLSQTVRGGRVTWLPSGHVTTADPDAVAEVINILLDNAVKHGGPDVSVDVDAIDDTVEIAVSDTGPGIAPEVRQRLFEWGARGPDSRGQGIGLSSAASVAESQKGYLELRDTDNQGTTFVVGLPAAKESHDHREQRERQDQRDHHDAAAKLA
jgi:signal transduction histidine kinase